MSQWKPEGQYPPNSNQGYYGGQPGYGQQGYPPPGGYPPPPGAYPAQGSYPPQGGYPTSPPPGSYPPPNQGFQPAQPPYGANDPYSTDYGGTGYGEDPEVKGFDFGDASIRRGFIRKVYSILSVQLGITLAFICWFLYHTPTRVYVHNHIGLFYASLVIVIVALIALACCGELRRKAPANYIFLLIFTLAESFCLACSASTYKADAVAMAVGITAAVCLGLTLFAFQTKWDFTMMGGILFAAVIILFVFGIFAIIFRNKVVQLVYASLGALIFSIYLVYDTQLMMGGKHTYSISPEEYIFAAINLYVDVINIFMYILAIIGRVRD